MYACDINAAAYKYMDNTHKSRYQWALFSSNKEVGDFTATFHWCKKANLTIAGSGEANKGDRRGC
jgi:hypothetical protein